MNDRDKTVYNEDITFYRTLAIILCFTIVLIPIGLLWFIYLSPPDDKINGFVGAKWSGRKTLSTVRGSTVRHTFYVSIGMEEFEVSGDMYRSLEVGDYIMAGYRKQVMYSFTKKV
ncbi:MAG: hypothetical protein FWE45_03965 [Firmicutes bacterium]|nr:hypothetical protein [Bacillota bacterium]